jgi:hypothetical protein
VHSATSRAVTYSDDAMAVDEESTEEGVAGVRRRHEPTVERSPAEAGARLTARAETNTSTALELSTQAGTDPPATSSARQLHRRVTQLEQDNVLLKQQVAQLLLQQLGGAEVDGGGGGALHASTEDCAPLKAWLDRAGAGDCLRSFQAQGFGMYASRFYRLRNSLPGLLAAF